MTRSMLFGSVSLVAALALGVAYAQTPPAAGQPAQPGAGAPAAQGGAPGYPGATPATEGPPWPIVFVASVELLRSKDGRDIVLARGLVTSKGWSQPNLIPINQGAPIDGPYVRGRQPVEFSNNMDRAIADVLHDLERRLV